MRNQRGRLWLGIGAGVVVLAIAAALIVEWELHQLQPRMRRKVVETLSARFHRPVELDRLTLSMEKDVVVTGAGLRILGLAGEAEQNAEATPAPIITVRSFEFRTGWRELLLPTTRVLDVKVDGLELRVPPKQQRGAMQGALEKQRQPALGLAIDRIECTNAKLVLETNVPEKRPLEFDIGRLVLTDVGPDKALGYEAMLRNPKPVGDVSATGSFGPWHGDDPRDTPLAGSYAFTHADLSSLRGVAGILASTGHFSGTLGMIAVNGAADVPDFRLDVSDHPVPLRADFDVMVDGTTGDTRLEKVNARVLGSVLLIHGAVLRTAKIPGHTTDLHVTMDHGRVQDILTLALKANPPLLRGAMTLREHIVIPPGTSSVTRKLRLDGTFRISNASFNNQQMQDKMNAMSMRAQGKPHMANAQDAQSVGATLDGSFSQDNAVVRVSQLDYRMPGAEMKLDGEVHLVGSTFEFRGVVRTQATASQMTTGWKSLLLSPFDKLLKKNGAGLELPVQVNGVGSTYDLRLNFPHDTRGPGVPPPVIPPVR
jgi:hypothetical protein